MEPDLGFLENSPFHNILHLSSSLQMKLSCECVRARRIPVYLYTAPLALQTQVRPAALREFAAGEIFC